MKTIKEHILFALISGIFGLLIYIALCESAQNKEIEIISSNIQSINNTLNLWELNE